MIDEHKIIDLAGLETFKKNITEGGKTVEKSSSYTLDNAVDYPIVDMRIYGKSTQDGVPTPDAPVEIVSVGDSGAVGVTACGKNLYEGSQDWSGKWENAQYWGDASETYLGLPVKKGKVQYSGIRKGIYVFAGKTYVFSAYAKYDTSTTENVSFIVSYGDKEGYAQPYNVQTVVNISPEWRRFEIKYTCTKSGYIVPRIEKKLYDANYLYVCGYQLEVGDTATEYEPYISSTANLTSALPLCGIPVSEGGNYTDSTGQQWIADEVVYNADGTGKIIKHTNKYVLSTTDSFGFGNGSKTPRIVFHIFDIATISVSTLRANMFCNTFPVTTSSEQFSQENIIGISQQGGNSTSVYISSSNTNSIDEFKTWLVDNPTYIIYELAEPQEIDLTAAEMAQLEALQTFDGVTNISNDGGADMQIKYCTNKALSEYEKPVIDGLKKQIDELKIAVLSLGGNV